MVTCPTGGEGGNYSNSNCSIGGRAGVSHEGEVDSRWGLVHNYPTLMNTMLCSYLILYT